jgi:tRNA threonylcarbamoyladenosine biosynthesis protein TsaB
MIVLGIETCSSLCGVALVRDGLVIGKFTINISNFHDEKLIGIISDLLKACSLKINDIDGFAVAIGPGSFTGIRIGMSVAKGLAVANEKPLAGVSVLDAFAYKVRDFAVQDKIETICSVIDAKRDEVYYSIFKLNGGIERIAEYDCKSIKELIPLIPEGTLFIGDAVEKLRSLLIPVNFIFAKGESNQNDPGVIALLGYEKISNSMQDNVDKLEPLYIKDFKPVTKTKGDL